MSLARVVRRRAALWTSTCLAVCASLTAALTLGAAAEGAAVAPTVAPGVTRIVLTTDGNQELQPGETFTQGWWGESVSNDPATANYLVGRCCGDEGEIRNFFTFDLSGVDGRVTFAVLRVHGGDFLVDGAETLRLFDVSTGPRVLNQTEGLRPDIFADLGTGVGYGVFAVQPASAQQWVRLPLNRAGLDALNRDRRYFSVGGRVTTLTSGLEEEYLFGGTGLKAARLVLGVRPA